MLQCRNARSRAKSQQVIGIIRNFINMMGKTPRSAHPASAPHHNFKKKLDIKIN
jgi:hypothetical protein